MSTDLHQQSPTTQAELATVEFIKNVYESNKEEALKLIQTAEGGAEAFVVNALKAAPRPGGMAGVMFGYFEPYLANYVANVIAKNGPQVVYEFIDAQLAHEVAVLKAAH